MFLLDGELVLSAGDLRTATECEFAALRQLDVLLDRSAPAQTDDDGLRRRVTDLGVQHEQAHLRRLGAQHPGERAMVTLRRPSYDRAGLTAAMQHTLAALHPPTEVAYQASVFDGSFVGHVDFVEDTGAGWQVSDTKLARQAAVPALLQVAAYADLLATAGVDVAPTVRLVLGDGVVEDAELDEVRPVYRARRARLKHLLDRHRSQPGVAQWGMPDVLACGRCTSCTPEVERARDLLMVGGMGAPTRRHLMDAGVSTIDALAAHQGPVAGVRESRLATLHSQAVLQVEHEGEAITHEVIDLAGVRRLPASSPGDLFFDFEGDPLWTERGSRDWGLEYLFGMVEVDTGEPVFRAFWAHDRAQERQALVDFVAYVDERRQQWPDLHIYHYAPYETAALLRLAARHGVCEDAVDQWLRHAVFVDLYSTVRESVRVSGRSYSLKKLEPLYMPHREGAVTAADESIVVYHQVIAATDAGQRDEARRLLAQIAAYNRDDCISTMLLDRWLRDLDDGSHPPAPVEDDVVEAPVQTPSEDRQRRMALEERLRARLDGISPADRTPEQQALALVAASVQFHAREDKPMWQERFARLQTPLGDWRPAEGVLLVHETELLADWASPGGRSSPRRTLRLTGEPMRGVALGTRAVLAGVYALPPPLGVRTGPRAVHAKAGSVTVREAGPLQEKEHGSVRQVLVVEEATPPRAGEHDMLPVALVPNEYVPTVKLDEALEELATQIDDSWPELPETAAIDVLLRRPPRMRGAGELPVVGDGDGRHIAAITTALMGMDDSCLAVQGPPGTGKTYVGARVIARLVERGWQIGVCSQGHAAIENMLDAVVDAGVPPGQVAKRPGSPERARRWTALSTDDDLAPFAAEQRAAGRGYVIGGTAWSVTHPDRVGRGELDLLVIDEAGQFSLAKTLAVSLAAERLLLLGDPQQLPQVSTGRHAEPIDASALGWLIGQDQVLPAGLGYFLETTWRMHPALCAAVSHLSYSGLLRSQEEHTAARDLEGVEPGLHVRLVEHVDNATWSSEEARAVPRLVDDLLGRAWTGPGTAGALLGQQDVLVIAPYNAQVREIRHALDTAGLSEVEVGTVDTMQGRGAPVVIMSMTASSHTDVARGMAFLLQRNRINVAISRGQHAAFLVRSPRLTDFAPGATAQLIALGAFLRLEEHAVSVRHADELVVAR